MTGGRITRAGIRIRSPRRKPPGFSLVEVVVFLFLVSLAVVATVWYIPRSALIVSTSEARVVADNIASELLLKSSRPFAELVPGTLQLEPVLRNGVSFRPTVEVLQPADEPGSLKEIRLTVEWSQKGRRYAHRQILRVTRLDP